MRHLPLSHLLTAGRPADYPVARGPAGRIPFSRLFRDVGHNAARIEAAGCLRGAPVCRDSYWFLVGLLALLHNGAEVAIPPNAQPGTLQSFADQCDLFVVDIPAGMAKALVLEPGTSASPPLRPYDPAAVPLHFFTSGTTGTPKRVTRSAALLEREVELLRALWGDAPGAALVSSTVSHQHVYGMMFRLLWPVETGRPFSTATHEVWETLLDEIEPGGVLVTSPAHLTRMAGIEPISPARAPALVLSAGAPLPAAAAAETARILGMAPTEMFGSTETGVCATRRTVPPDQLWRPLPGVRFGVTGEDLLKIDTPAVGAGTWHETADIVDLLPDGTFRFRGRADRIVKIEGKRVSLAEVEQRLSRLRWVRQAAVTLAGDGAGRLAAAVVLAPAGQAKREALGDFRFGRFLRQELSRTQEPAGRPRLWRFVDSLPHGAMGKRRDADLAALFAKGPGT